MTADGYLHQPAFERLWAAARARWEANGGPRGSVRLAAVNADEADALEGLMDPGRRRRAPLRAGESFQITLARLDERLVNGPGTTLQAVLQAAGGPLRNKPAERAAAQAETAGLWERAGAHPAAARPEIAAWIESVRRHGTLSRAVPGDAQTRWRALDRALTVIASLPADGLELSRLASELAGDTHALDFGTPLGGLTAAGVAAVRGRDRPQTAGQWRAVWAAAGVLCDSLSCAVLTYGLAPLDAHPVAQATRAMTADREPHVLTLRALSRRPLTVAAQTVFVCENPAVISYAAERELAGVILVCSAGWPNTAVAKLLRQLSASGCPLRAQGDFDWEGVRIHRHLVHVLGAHSWRFDATTYQAGARGAGAEQERRLADDRVALSTPLTRAMFNAGVAVYEEDVCELLATDLLPPAVTC